MTDSPESSAESRDGFQRVIQAWYAWQALKDHRRKGSARQGKLLSGQRPPTLGGDGSLSFVDELDVSYFLVPQDGVYYVDNQERGARQRFQMFRRLDDAEKFLLIQFSQSARPGKLSDSPVFKWYRAGLAPDVSIHHPESANFPGRVSLRVDGEPEDRGWMGETDAISFSHVVKMSFEELDRTLRAGIPPDWFSGSGED